MLFPLLSRANILGGGRFQYKEPGWSKGGKGEREREVAFFRSSLPNMVHSNPCCFVFVNVRVSVHLLSWHRCRLIFVETKTLTRSIVLFFVHLWLMMRRTRQQVMICMKLLFETVQAHAQTALAKKYKKE